jgi:hypothetical protein
MIHYSYLVIGVRNISKIMLHGQFLNKILAGNRFRPIRLFICALWHHVYLERRSRMQSETFPAARASESTI